MKRHRFLKAQGLGVASLAFSAASPKLRGQTQDRGGSQAASAIEFGAPIKQVCAWPNLQVLKDQTIIATIFNQPCHGRWEGDLDCWASRNGGKSWSFRGRAAKHEPGTNRMNCAVGFANNGDLLALCSGRGDRSGPDKPSGNFGNPLPAWACRSSDRAKTWKVIGEFPAPPRHKISPLPYQVTGHLARLGDGRVLLSFGNRNWNNYGVDVRFSDDEGKSWGPPLRIGNAPRGDCGYPSTVELAGGQAVTAYYTQISDGYEYEMRSAIWRPQAFDTAGRPKV